MSLTMPDRGLPGPDFSGLAQAIINAIQANTISPYGAWLLSRLLVQYAARPSTEWEVLTLAIISSEKIATLPGDAGS